LKIKAILTQSGKEGKTHFGKFLIEKWDGLDNSFFKLHRKLVQSKVYFLPI
jgi:hypothetical protein